MIVAAIVVAYIAIGIYRAIIDEPWWYDTLGREREWPYPRGYYCVSCSKELNKRNVAFTECHIKSGVLAALASGLLWPLFPLVRRAIDRRGKIVKAKAEKRKREAEREKEMKEAEKELDI